ncbi:MAG: hypothetical protein ABR592_04530 [Nitriliruptorales bacterium]
MSKVLRSMGGPKPGEPFPDFDLRTVAGEHIRKADYVGRRPLLMLCGSITTSKAKGAGAALRRLYDEYGDRVAFVTLHRPEDQSDDAGDGPQTLAHRLTRARSYQYRERIPWTVAVDDLDPTLERALEATDNAVYVMTRDGTVAFRTQQGSDEQLLWDALHAVAAELPQVDVRADPPIFPRIITAYRALPAPMRAAVAVAAALVPLVVAVGGAMVSRRRRG